MSVKNHCKSATPIKDNSPSLISEGGELVFFAKRIEKFLSSVQDAYSESWNSNVQCNEVDGSHVIRGRARCIAGKVEDLLSSAIYDILKDCIVNLFIFVDMPLSYRDRLGNKKVCYPDIIVAERKFNSMNVLYFVEVKVNLGWGRCKLSGEEVCKDATGKKSVQQIKPIEEELIDELDTLKNTDVWSKPPIGMKECQYLSGLVESGKLKFSVSSDTRYDLILCSSRNVPKDILKKARTRIARNLCAACQLYVLSDEELSRKYASKKSKEKTVMKLCSDDVKEWEQRIKMIFSQEKTR